MSLVQCSAEGCDVWLKSEGFCNKHREDLQCPNCDKEIVRSMDEGDVYECPFCNAELELTDGILEIVSDTDEEPDFDEHEIALDKEERAEMDQQDLSEFGYGDDEETE